MRGCFERGCEEEANKQTLAAVAMLTANELWLVTKRLLILLFITIPQIYLTCLTCVAGPAGEPAETVTDAIITTGHCAAFTVIRGNRTFQYLRCGCLSAQLSITTHEGVL